ncbi:uncharacterized protein LOC111599673 [Drosophila hydei]|uniref:Uncharacterized protein LOC111599673 n=1 Tax=Drosophila hydei TaxID=7224 RepID=A0A6J1LTA8_DROHY|nr:uncharacterized protein LOC111599673 [Drosophila hydei]
MKCKVLNRTRIDIKECSLKDMSGGILSANIQLKVHQPPDPNWMVTFGVWKDMGGYKPFFYNVSFDFCGFLKNPNRLQIYYLFHKAILPFSNLNQSCPFLHDIVVKDFVLADKMFTTIPIPKGRYMYNLLLASNSFKAIDLRFYIYVDVRETLRRKPSG